MVRSMIRSVVGLIAAVTLISCAATSHRDPMTISLDEALAVLRRAESFAQTDDFEVLCSMNGNVSMCQHHLRTAGGPDSVPIEPPRIVDSYIIPNEGSSLGGRVIVLKGIDRQGKPYTTEFLVFDQGDNHLVPLIPVYWSGIGIARGNVTSTFIPQP